ncbi:unnamed protein product [Merluccius merluccius]
MSTAIEATGFVLCIISWLITGAALGNDYWKVSTVAGNIITSVRQYENLWHTCTETSTGIAQCQDFESLLGLAGYVQACRGLMIVALLLGLSCLVVALLGIKCIKIGSASDQAKIKMAAAGGIMSGLAGVCTLVAVSWYAHMIVEDFYDPFTGGIKFELGAGLYMGWAGAFLAVLGGGMLCCACKRATPAGKPRVSSQPSSVIQPCNFQHTELTANMSTKSVIFKKVATDKSVTVYMGKRDFVDRVDSVDPVDGVLLVDPEALNGRKAFVTLSCVFRYGRDDMDVLGLAFKRELYLSTRQVYPPLLDREQGVHTKLQGKLMHKLGDNAYPFFFEFPDNLPCSVGLQPGPHDSGKQCAVEFEIKAFSAESQDAKIRKRSAVKLMLRKVQYAPETDALAESVMSSRDFITADKPLHVEATLEKETFYHGETINVHVSVSNNSNKNVKNIIVSVDQVSTVVLYSNDSYVKSVAIKDSGDAVSAGASLQKVYTLLPLLANNKERRGIALDGKLKHEDTNLASSSIIKDGVLKEVMGILVTYKVMVKLVIGGELGLEVPFKLMHPKPDAGNVCVELEEELVFAEFKRSYMKGMTDPDEEEGNVSGGEDMGPKEK